MRARLRTSNEIKKAFQAETRKAMLDAIFLNVGIIRFQVRWVNFSGSFLRTSPFSLYLTEVKIGNERGFYITGFAEKVVVIQGLLFRTLVSFYFSETWTAASNKKSLSEIPEKLC